MEHEEYLKELAQRLRWRHLPDAAVTDALREVASEVQDSQVDPEVAFGPAETYAASFPRGRSASLGFVLATVGTVIAALVVAGYAVSTIVGANSHSLGRSLLIYGLAFVGMVALVLAGSRIDRRLPPGLET